MTYIIAEIGQNHNGSVPMALDLIDAAEYAGCDAVKFTIRDLDYEMTDEQAASAYESPNAFGHTYMEHRQKLELDVVEYNELIPYARAKGLEVVITYCHGNIIPLVGTPDKVKVASRDITNIPLLCKVAEMNIPTILSSGMSTIPELSVALKTITEKHFDVTLLHCISDYPTKDSDINLGTMSEISHFFRKKYPIGYSDHSDDWLAPLIAVGMGATVIERHITLDRRLKGSDHKVSSEPRQMKEMVKHIRRAEKMLSVIGDKQAIEGVKKNRKKLMRSLSTIKEVKKGTVLKTEHIGLLSPGDGKGFSEIGSFINRVAAQDIPTHTTLREEMVV